MLWHTLPDILFREHYLNFPVMLAQRYSLTVNQLALRNTCCWMPSNMTCLPGEVWPYPVLFSSFRGSIVRYAWTQSDGAIICAFQCQVWLIIYVLHVCIQSVFCCILFHFAKSLCASPCMDMASSIRLIYMIFVLKVSSSPLMSYCRTSWFIHSCVETIYKLSPIEAFCCDNSCMLLYGSLRKVFLWCFKYVNLFWCRPSIVLPGWKLWTVSYVRILICILRQNIEMNIQCETVSYT